MLLVEQVADYLFLSSIGLFLKVFDLPSKRLQCLVMLLVVVIFVWHFLAYACFAASASARLLVIN